jgi:hypothetical protein
MNGMEIVIIGLLGHPHASVDGFIRMGDLFVVHVL